MALLPITYFIRPKRQPRTKGYWLLQLLIFAVFTILSLADGEWTNVCCLFTGLTFSILFDL